MHEFWQTLAERKGQLLSTIIEHIQICLLYTSPSPRD